jgi:4-amino-4-deoxy-L-arabinose transferase-like glycosyltransferase
MQQVFVHSLLLATIAVAVFFTNLGGPRLWDRDEPRNAGCAAEMLARNDWVTPVFDGELRTHKPVLLHWFMICAYELLGVNEFAARFWSAALGVGTVLCTYGIGRRLFHPRAGLWAGVALATALMFGVAARAATPDSVLIFFTTAATLAYVLTAFPSGESLERRGLFPRSWWAAALIYALMGFAVLAKGPVGAVLPMAVIGMYLLIVRLPPRASAEIATASRSRRIIYRLTGLIRPFAPLHFARTLWSMRPITAIVVVLAVAAPWYILVGLRTDGAWLRDFFLKHNVGRAAGAMEGHGGPIVFYPIALLAGTFPWSVLCAPVFVNLARCIRGGGRLRDGTIFAACWVGVYVGLFSLASTKLPSYITPCYPGAALLIGLFLHRWTAGEFSLSPRVARMAWIALAVVGTGIAIGAPIAARLLLPGEEWLGAIGLVLIAAAAVGWRLGERQPRRTAIVLAATAAAFAILLFAVGAERVDRHRQSELITGAIHDRGLDAPVGSYKCLEPSWVFYAGRPIEELVHRPGGNSPRAFTTRPSGETVPRPDLHSFLANDARAVVITTGKDYGRIRSELAPDITVLAEAPYFLENERLLLLGRSRERLAEIGREKRR